MIFEAAIPTNWQALIAVIAALEAIVLAVLAWLRFGKKDKADVSKSTVETVIQGGDWVTEKMKGLIGHLEKKVAELETRLEQVERELYDEKTARNEIEGELGRKEGSIKRLRNRLDWLLARLPEDLKREYSSKFKEQTNNDVI